MSEETKKDESGSKVSTNDEETPVAPASAAPPPSMTTTLFFYWILPVFLLTIFARFGVKTSETPSSSAPPRPISLEKLASADKRSRVVTQKKKNYANKQPSPSSANLSKMPTSYQQVVKQIQQRRPRWQMSSTSEAPSTTTKDDRASSVTKAEAPKSLSSTTQSEANMHSDPTRRRMDNVIQQMREEYQVNPNDVEKAIHLAEALRQRDLTYHDGGSGQLEALELYQTAIDQTLKKRQEAIGSGKSTTTSLSATKSVAEEFLLDYSVKSIDGLLCALYTSMGKQYFMANMFEKAVESYDQCLLLESMYLDALNSRGSSLIILGRYMDAAQDLQTVIQHDSNRFFKDAFTAMARVLVAKEDAGEWEPMISTITDLIPELEAIYNSEPQAKTRAAEALNRLYHVLFTYNDVKTNDTAAAWKALWTGYTYKMSALTPFPSAFEKQKVQQIQQIFHRGFWPAGVGSSTRVPIFIIGFVRSGSTLLERVLDAHPLIVGTGEDSVFNGKLDYIRNSIVQASMSGSPEELATTVEQMADEVVTDMRKRWQVIDANTKKTATTEEKTPERFADKMLTNYLNVGFIHMIFPKALILHVAREPMDTVFSAYKHEFPPGTLDYTSEFSSLAELYHAYRNIMEHWDAVLPGRVMHVRYEDMVHDMPGMAKAIVDATHLPWDDGVLNFHKKKQAVNTLSTTQVRKGVYKHSLQAWKRYEEPLQPLVKLIGDRVEWDLKTTLPTYTPPPQQDET